MEGSLTSCYGNPPHTPAVHTVSSALYTIQILPDIHNSARHRAFNFHTRWLIFFWSRRLSENGSCRVWKWYVPCHPHLWTSILYSLTKTSAQKFLFFSVFLFFFGSRLSLIKKNIIDLIACTVTLSEFQRVRNKSSDVLVPRKRRKKKRKEKKKPAFWCYGFDACLWW